MLRDTLHARGVPQPVLEACAPGGADNQVTDTLGACVMEYALLRAQFALVQKDEADRAARTQRALGDALSNTPISVTCADGTIRSVHPKSWHALRYLDFLDAAARDVAELASRLDDMEVRAYQPLIESLAVQLWAWIVTCAEPGLPFEEGGEPIEPPAWTKTLMPEDLLALVKAHLTVNRERVQLVSALFPADPAVGESRLTLAGFLGTVAQELGHRPSDVLRGWTMGEVFAQAVTAAESAREQKEKAERESRERRAS